MTKGGRSEDVTPRGQPPKRDAPPAPKHVPSRAEGLVPSKAEGAAPPTAPEDDVGLADVAPGAGPDLPARADDSTGDENVFVDDLGGGSAPAARTVDTEADTEDDADLGFTDVRPTSRMGPPVGIEKKLPPAPAAPTGPPAAAAAPPPSRSGVGEKRRSSSGRNSGVGPALEPAKSPPAPPPPSQGQRTSDDGIIRRSRLSGASGRDSGVRDVVKPGEPAPRQRSPSESGREKALTESGRFRRMTEDARASAAGAAVEIGPPDDLSPGSAVGAWEILEPAGREDGVAVFKVEREGRTKGLLRYYAFELFGSSALEAVSRAERAAGIRHDSLEPVLDQDRTPAGAWFVVPESTSLEAAIAANGPLKEPEALEVLRGVARALAALHARGIVHGDPSPRHLVKSGGQTRLGATARAVPARGLESLAPAGTGNPRYAAPELLDGLAPTPASDVFALGLVLFFLLSGRAPVSADDPVEALVLRLKLGAPELPAGTRPEVRALYEHATAEANRRYPTADELVRDLEAVIDGRSAKVALPPPPEPPTVRVRPPVSIALVLICAAVAVATFALILVLATAVVDPTAEHTFELPPGTPKPIGSKK